MTAYGNASLFKMYHQVRSREISDSWSDELIEGALLVASEWLDNKYGELFYGQQTGGYLQERQWPRESAYTNTLPSYVFASNEIPTKVTYAAFEAAYRELSEAGSLQVDYTPSEFKSVKVDGAVAIEYAGINQASEIQKQIMIVEQLLTPLLDTRKAGANSMLSGSTTRA